MSATDNRYVDKKLNYMGHGSNHAFSTLVLKDTVLGMNVNTLTSVAAPTFQFRMKFSVILDIFKIKDATV